MNDNTLDTLLNPNRISSWEKLLKIPQYIGAYTNWLECLRLRKQVGQPTGETSTAYFRNGLKMDVRVGTPDISILYEVLISGAYSSTEQLLEMAEKPCSVIDLGANIGAFTLRCAIANPGVHVYAYEPGPQNAGLLERNLELNSHLRDRIHFFQEAATKDTRTAYWHFDERNPGGSQLVLSDRGVAVQTRSFSAILERCQYPIALVKIDIEGSEYELIEGTDRDLWKSIPAIFVEIHEDPTGQSTPKVWFDRMAELGFKTRQREGSSILLLRE